MDGAAPFPIHDLWVRPLTAVSIPAGAAHTALTDAEPVLHRFGLAQVVRADPESPPALRLRSHADEVWAVLEGRAALRWLDLREGSPTRGARFDLACHEPTRVLVPFGVAFGVHALDGPALLLRLATHTDADPAAAGDRSLPWDAAP